MAQVTVDEELLIQAHKASGARASSRSRFRPLLAQQIPVNSTAAMAMNDESWCSGIFCQRRWEFQ
jgi:hypothetical protein